MDYESKIHKYFILTCINLIAGIVLLGAGLWWFLDALEVGNYQDMSLSWILMLTAWLLIKMAEINIDKVSPFLDEWEAQVNEELRKLKSDGDQ